MRRLLPILLSLTACAPAARAPLSPEPQAPSEVQATSSGGYNVRLARREGPVTRTYAASVDSVWPIALQAYTGVGLRIDAADTASHHVQTRRLIVHRRMDDQRLSSMFDCGTDITGEIADSWRVQIDAAMVVSPAATPENSTVAIKLKATAAPVAGTGSEVSPCESRGRLESMLMDSIRRALAE